MITFEQALEKAKGKPGELQPRKYKDCGDFYLFSLFPPDMVVFGEPWLRVDKVTGETSDFAIWFLDDTYNKYPDIEINKTTLEGDRQCQLTITMSLFIKSIATSAKALATSIIGKFIS